MLTPNTTLQHGRYRIIRRIGQGGMGAVYEAYDNNLSNSVAVKEALVDDPALRRAFEREALRLDRLRHPALPNVRDHFIEGDGQYLVMEFIDGQDFRERLKQRGQPFPLADVLLWANTLLDALTYLHQEGVIHRDIKPANIKLTPKGQVILLDFGLAKGGLTQQTLTGHSLYGYSPGYAPPEQIAGEPTDERSDLYALATTVYALLTAQAPADAFLRQRYISDGYPDPLQPADQLNPDVPPHVAQLLQHAMALDPGRRPNSAAQMRNLLNVPLGNVTVPSIGQPIAATPSLSTLGNPSIAKDPRGTSSGLPQQSDVGTSNPNRRPLLLGVMMAAVLLLVAAFVVRNWISDSAPTDPTAVASTTKDGMVEVYVPEGEFEMGSGDDDPDMQSDEQPRHTVYLDAFFLDQTEVTNAMFANFLNEMGNQVEGNVTWLDQEDKDALIEQVNGTFQPKNGFANHPVVEVSWYAANAYCQWAERRLPTEAEWEKAAGGVLTEEGSRKYPWGNDTPTGERLNFCDQHCTNDWKDSSTDDGYLRTSPVGNYPAGASPYGALDMAGNVWEWVSDYYDSNYYASSPRDNPTGPSSSSGKAHRGGSWYDSAPGSRVRNRNEVGADFRDEVAGFRCARSP